MTNVYHFSIFFSTFCKRGFLIKSSWLFNYSQLAFVANRKNLDQHILLFGWSVGDTKNEAAIIEILNDNWSPKIEAHGDLSFLSVLPYLV